MNKSRGWEIYPKGLYDFAMKARDEYPELEWFVSENGIGIEREDLKKDENGVIQVTRSSMTSICLSMMSGAMPRFSKGKAISSSTLAQNSCASGSCCT